MLRSKMIIACFLLLEGSITFIDASERTVSLILAEFGKDAAGDQTQTLVRYRFKAGVLISREHLITRKTDELRFDLGNNQIFQNRYIITNWGDIVDLASKQLLLKSKGKLVRVEGDSVIIRVDRLGEKKGFFAFSLSSHEYREIKQNALFKAPSLLCKEAQLNPSGLMSAYACNDGIWLQYQNGQRKKLEGSFFREGTLACSDLYTPTLVWANDHQILTQIKNGHLVLVNLNNKIESLVTLPDFEPPPCGPELRRDQNNQIYYEAIGKAWHIDIEKHSFDPYLWEGVGNGFDVEFQRNNAYGHRIRYHGEEIGQYWCDSAHTISGHIAIAFGPVGSNLGYPEGVKVWSSQNSQWTTIKPDWLVDIIGWVEE
jgi:hypothetical protein